MEQAIDTVLILNLKHSKINEKDQPHGLVVRTADYQT
jgi:hypothetical protein